MNVNTRISIEKKIAKAIIKTMRKAGYSISIFEGEDYSIRRSKNKADILEAMFSTDEDRIDLYKKDALDGTVKRHGWIMMIYGNDGYDVVNDYTTNLEELMKPINKLCDELQEKYA